MPRPTLERLEERCLLTVDWSLLSSATGDLPAPEASNGQTASLVFDVDQDGFNDFVIAQRSSSEPVTWYRRTAAGGWDKYIIDAQTQSLEAGGTFEDIDQDGDMDVVFGEDWTGNKVYWWENPYPVYQPATPWTRRLIKDSGGNTHHDMGFADVDGDGQNELVSFNQGSKRLLLLEIPIDPQTAGPWPSNEIFSWSGGSHEGLAFADVNLDGKTDIVGAGKWFEHTGGTDFTAHVVDASRAFVRAAAGQLVSGGRPEIVFVPGDADGPLTWYQWDGAGWQSHTLETDVSHGHSLDVGDVNADGNLDIFNGEMGQWGSSPNNPDATITIYYGDGSGDFTKQVVLAGQGTHEGRLADLDGDGDLDILVKPFRHNAPRIDVLINDTLSPNLSLNRWQRHEIESDLPWRTVFVNSADFDQDGFVDVVTGGWWYRNPGLAEGSWVRNAIGSPLNNLAAVFDFDEDGDPDVLGTQGVGSSSNADFVWARNDGQGTFTILNNVESGNGDFLQGVAVDRFGPGAAGSIEVALSWHNGGGGIQMLTVGTDPSVDQWTWRNISSASQDEQLSSGDIDSDGDSDLLLGTEWLRNEETGWTPSTTYATSAKPDRNRLADINRDGRLDAVVGYEAISTPGKVAWYEQPAGDPSGTWTEHVIATIVGPMSVDVADLDGDGDIDVVVGEHNPADPAAARLFVFENADGQGTDWVQHLVHTGDEHHDGAHLVDIDVDGDLDIVSIGWSNDKVVLYENLAIDSPTNSTNAPPVARNDAYQTTPATPLVVDAASGVLASDSDPDLDPLHALLVDDVTDGILNLNADGSFDYTPNSGFRGKDSFTYVANDTLLESNVATVTIDVTESGATALVVLPLDEGSGTFAGDVSGNGNHGTLLNGAALEANTGDGSPSAVRFDGIDDSIDLGALDVSGTALTLAAWFHADSFPGSANDPRLISKASGTASDQHVFMLSTIQAGSVVRLRGRVRVGGSTTTLIASSGDLSTGEWRHAALTYDGGTLRLYLDGVEVGNTPLSGTIDTDPTLSVAVGSQPAGAGPRFFDGLIDDVRILQRALSADELGVIASGSPITSDDFCCGTLSPHVWTFVDPLGDGSVQMAGASTEAAQVEIQVPGGISHQPWGVNNAPRIMQQVATDTDFEIEAKFDSTVTLQYQEQGIIVEQDPDNYLRFDFFSDGAGINVFAASINNLSPSQRIFSPISIVEPIYMRVTRAGDQWTLSYSDDGADWTVAGSFVEAMTVQRVGVFAGNHSADGTSAPPFTARVDYFFETSTPIIPEDAGANSARADFNGDGAVTAADIDLLFAAQRTGSTDPRFDLNDDSRIDGGDVDLLVHDILGTRYGDANLDGQVDAKDLNDVGLNWAGTEKTWAQGDFTGDGRINAADLNRLALNWRSGVEAQAPAVDRAGDDSGRERLPRAPLAVAVQPITAPARDIERNDATPNANYRKAIVPTDGKHQVSATFAMARTRLGILGRRHGR